MKVCAFVFFPMNSHIWGCMRQVWQQLYSHCFIDSSAGKPWLILKVGRNRGILLEQHSVLWAPSKACAKNHIFHLSEDGSIKNSFSVAQDKDLETIWHARGFVIQYQSCSLSFLSFFFFLELLTFLLSRKYTKEYTRSHLPSDSYLEQLLFLGSVVFYSFEIQLTYSTV